jgi:hypothetical protein
MSPTSPIGIICIASPCGKFSRERADFAVENSANDTRDTKPSSRDTPTIQGVTTIRDAGVIDVYFVAKAVS